MSNLAQGFIEVTGYVHAVQAADTMAKTADVAVARVHKVDGPRVCVICEGDVAACKAAVDAAVSACGPDGVITSNIIPHPAGGTEELHGFLEGINLAKVARKQARLKLRNLKAKPKQG